jgi:hypothetical protein
VPSPCTREREIEALTYRMAGRREIWKVEKGRNAVAGGQCPPHA